MSYASDHPVRLVGGRLALDLVNTADWSAEGEVAHEKIESLEDLTVWLHALGLPNVKIPSSADAFRTFRFDLRAFLRSASRPNQSGLRNELDAVRPRVDVERQPLTALAVMSAFSIVADPREFSRVKTCPGNNCGWMFMDETRNGRRTWCLMETCGNRAKAARHYRRIREERRNS